MKRKINYPEIKHNLEDEDVEDFKIHSAALGEKHKNNLVFCKAMRILRPTQLEATLKDPENSVRVIIIKAFGILHDITMAIFWPPEAPNSIVGHVRIRNKHSGKWNYIPI